MVNNKLTFLGGVDFLKLNTEYIMRYETEWIRALNPEIPTRKRLLSGQVNTHDFCSGPMRARPETDKEKKSQNPKPQTLWTPTLPRPNGRPP